MVSLFIVLIAFVALGAWTTGSINSLEKTMSAQSDKIIAAFDDFKADVTARLAALETKVSAAQGLSDTEAKAILDDIAAAKAAVDAQPTDGKPA